MNRADRAGLRTWIEIDRKKIAKNYRLFRSLITKKTKLMAVLKSNAYGHELTSFAREMERLGVDFIGVDSVVEAFALRKSAVCTPILVLGYTLPELIQKAAAQDISLTVSNFESLSLVLKASKKTPIKIHIKVDTGMHRQGFLANDLLRVLKKLQAKHVQLKVSLDGLYSHFAEAKNLAFPKYTKMQIAEFKKWITAFRKAGFRPLSHIAASGGTLLFPESHFDMVRIGIGMYGLWPAQETRAACERNVTLEPALSWRSIITEVKKLPRGAKVGYDCTETLDRPSTIGIVPIGYWHGYPRALSSIAPVLVRGKRAKVLGRVSMDMTTIDITDIKGTKVGDTVTLIGKDGKAEITVEEVAELSGTSNYEFITRLNPLIKRLYR